MQVYALKYDDLYPSKIYSQLFSPCNVSVDVLITICRSNPLLTPPLGMDLAHWMCLNPDLVVLNVHGHDLKSSFLSIFNLKIVQFILEVHTSRY